MSWDHVLDALEAELAAAGVAGATDVAPAFRPPEGLGVLPAALAPRAAALLRSIEERSDLVAREMARTVAELGVVTGMAARAPRPPSMLDTRL